MKKNRFKNIDFTKGNIMQELILFAVPLMVGSVFSLLYGMVDSAVLGRFVGMQALAAVGATATTTMLVNQFVNAVTNAMSIQASQAWGAKDEEKMHRILAQCLLIAVFLGLAILIAIRFAARPLMRLLSTPADIIDDAVLYVRITCGFYICQLLYASATSVLRAIGDSRAPLWFLIFCSLLNIGLDLLFVVVFHWDVRGVALATVLSQLLSAVLCSVYLFSRYPVLRFRLCDLKPDREILTNYAKIALPITFQGVMLSIGDLTVTSIINSFGTDTVAAYTIGVKCIQIVEITFSQVAFSMSVYTGQNFGAGQAERIRIGIRKAILLLSVLVGASMLAMLLLGDRFMLIYMDPETAGDVVPGLVRQYLRVTTCFLPSLCLICMFNSALRGMGFITPTIISSFIELGCKIGFSVLLAHLFGTLGLWFAMPAGWVLGLIPSMIFYYSFRWIKKVPRSA